jgi:hypothetical protein
LVGVNSNALLASIMLGFVGMGLSMYGKRQRRWPHLAVGVLLMVYPYFVSNVAIMLVIGGTLLAGLYLASYLGL